MRNEFDLRLALCFAAVAEERSFTRAAKRLGIAQPSVSEQVKRLEEQLCVPLLVRNSRKVELTAAGTSFLPVAQLVAHANEEAQAYARRVRRRSAALLRIGAPYYSAEFEEREFLIGEFMAQAPQLSLDIIHAWNSDLIGQLRRNEIDLAFVQGRLEMTGLESILVYRRYAHYLVPQESPLAQLDNICAESLRGEKIVSIMPHVDQAAYDAYYRRLANAGAILVSTPEHHNRTMELFARTRRLALLRFGRAPGHKRELGNMVRVPSCDTPPLVAEMLVVRRPEPGSQALERFWRLCQSYAVAHCADDQERAGAALEGTAPV